MKTIVYMATTANGMVARSDDNTDFISELEWNTYLEAVRRSGNVIVGRRTYEVLQDDQLDAYGDAIVCVVTRVERPPRRKHHIAVGTPEAAIAMVGERGCTTALISGGAQLNASALEAGLVDEIILDIEPHLLGSGIPFAVPAKFDVPLELIEVRVLSPENQNLQLRYGVVR